MTPERKIQAEAMRNEASLGSSTDAELYEWIMDAANRGKGAIWIDEDFEVAFEEFALAAALSRTMARRMKDAEAA